ncbi:hypothetical protein F2Q68_00032600 [Brassica cretica]|uniref:Uncharacterized protein n=1 Tax=Brassica cretica TaxID=69181 RepID=A0A8S9G5N4_BRACR|nr:hypothetical protein F2Q68_00032600 [Brassica cretica]
MLYRCFERARLLRSRSLRARSIRARLIRARSICARSICARLIRARSLRTRSIRALSIHARSIRAWSIRDLSIRARSLRSDRSVYVLGHYVATELGWSSVATDLFREFSVAGFLKTLEYWQRGKFWDLVSGCLILCLEILETSALGLGQDLGSRLIRLVWLEPSISRRTIFKPSGSADQKFWVSFIALLPLCRMYGSHLYEMAKSV